MFALERFLGHGMQLHVRTQSLCSCQFVATFAAFESFPVMIIVMQLAIFFRLEAFVASSALVWPLIVIVVHVPNQIKFSSELFITEIAGILGNSVFFVQMSYQPDVCAKYFTIYWAMIRAVVTVIPVGVFFEVPFRDELFIAEITWPLENSMCFVQVSSQGTICLHNFTTHWALFGARFFILINGLSTVYFLFISYARQS